jgi:hypothetical protein
LIVQTPAEVMLCWTSGSQQQHTELDTNRQTDTTRQEMKEVDIFLNKFTFYSPKLAELDSCMVTLTAIAESDQLEQHDRFYEEKNATHT